MTKNQHFVPQFYLRRFLNQSNVVEVFDSKAEKFIQPKGTSKLNSAEFFYGVDTGKSDEISQQIEDWFKGIESKINEGLDTIIEKILNDKQIEHADKKQIAYLMCLIWIRNPQIRNQIQLMTSDTIQWMLKYEYSIRPEQNFDKFDKAKGKTTPPELRKKITDMMVNGELKIAPNNAGHINFLQHLPEYANMFYHQYWTVYVSKTHKKFITTDNPVIVETPKAKGFYGASFFEREHTFPLTPDICIVASEPHNLTDLHEIKFKRKTILKSNDKRVLELNTVIVNRSHQFIYSRSKQDIQDLLDARKRWDEFIRTPEGKRAKAKRDSEQGN